MRRLRRRFRDGICRRRRAVSADGYILSNVEDPGAPEPIVVDRAVVVFIEPDSSFSLITTDTADASIEIAGIVFAADDTVFLVEGRLNAGAFDTATVAYARSGSQLGFAASGLQHDVDGDLGLEPVVFDMVLNFAGPLPYRAPFPAEP